MTIAVIATIGMVIGFYFIGRSNTRIIQTLVVEVDYYDHWNATIAVNGISEQFSYYSKDTIILNRLGSNLWKISIACSKNDGSTGALVVRVKLTDGTVIKHAQTDSPYGTVEVDIEL